LEFLCVEPQAFEKAVQSMEKDEEILSWLKGMLGTGWPTQNAIQEFNEKLTRRSPDSPEKRKWFEERLKACPPARKKIETYFDLIDLDEGRLS